MTYHATNSLTKAHVLNLVLPQLRNVKSGSDLTKRLADIGFGYRDTARGRVLTTLPHGIDVTLLPTLTRF